MSVLSEKTAAANWEQAVGRFAGSGILASCANHHCATGWLRLWRSRSGPVFERGWTCSAACTEERIRAAVRRELEGRANSSVVHRHRMPIGLVMMEQGWITAAQLKHALDAQKASGGARLGHYLVAQGAASEQSVTRALSLQWNCPVFRLQFHDPEALSPLLPRLFIDAFGALPLRVAAGKLAYLGYEERLDPVVALALERMSGLRVESGLVLASEFRPAQDVMLKSVFPPVQLLEAVSEPALVRVLARAVEKVRPVESRLVRVHEFLWLRMWKRADSGAIPDASSIEDVIGSIGE